MGLCQREFAAIAIRPSCSRHLPKSHGCINSGFKDATEGLSSSQLRPCLTDYSYDAAHRLAGVTGAKSNSVSYILDAMGNKTAEQVKDPSGNLQRNITRVYDALNRVQQVTGAGN